jgi:hypothetical protein
MNYLYKASLICLFFIACNNTNKESVPLLEKNNFSPETATVIQSQVEEIILPKMEINKENIFKEFPATPDYFIENGINVTIRVDNDQPQGLPRYFGISPVYVTGDNFEIIYKTDNGYSIGLIILTGKSMFLYWDQFFDATWDDIEKVWGTTDGSCYYDDGGWYFVDFFSVDETSGKIKEIRLGQSL